MKYQITAISTSLAGSRQRRDRGAINVHRPATDLSLTNLKEVDCSKASIIPSLTPQAQKRSSISPTRRGVQAVVQGWSWDLKDFSRSSAQFYSDHHDPVLTRALDAWSLETAKNDVESLASLDISEVLIFGKHHQQEKRLWYTTHVFDATCVFALAGRASYQYWKRNG